MNKETLTNIEPVNVRLTDNKTSVYTHSKSTFMIEELVKELALRLIKECNLSMKEALNRVYNSETYSKILDLQTGLFSQSTAYVYSILETELLTGRMG